MDFTVNQLNLDCEIHQWIIWAREKISLNYEKNCFKCFVWKSHLMGHFLILGCDHLCLAGHWSIWSIAVWIWGKIKEINVVEKIFQYSQLLLLDLLTIETNVLPVQLLFQPNWICLLDFYSDECLQIIRMRWFWLFWDVLHDGRHSLGLIKNDTSDDAQQKLIEFWQLD